MYISQAYRYLHDAWRYIIGAAIVFIISQIIGAIPFIAAVMIKLHQQGRSFLELESDPMLMMKVLDSNLTLFLMLLSFAIGLLSLYYYIKWVHKQPFLTVTTSRPKTDWGRVAFGFMLISVFTIVVTGIDYYSTPEDYVIQFDLVPFLILAVIAIIMIPIQTSFEEYLFRGYLMQGIGVMAGNRWVPLVVTSVIFGGLHFFNPEVEKLGPILMVYYIGTGFLLGIMTLMDDGMELALGFHAANNLVAALLVTADWTVFQTNSILKDVSDPQVGYDILIPVLVIYPLFLAIMAYKYKWRNWGDKLFGKVTRPVDTLEQQPS